jgi:hypothetical protein
MYETAENNFADRREREEDEQAEQQLFLTNEWFEAVTTKPIDAPVSFKDRPDRSKKLSEGIYLARPSTVAEVFDDVRDYKDFSGRMIEVIVQAHKNGDAAASKLLADMANAYGYYTA